MESLSFLKYWRPRSRARCTTATLVAASNTTYAAVSPPSDTDDDVDVDDEGPFFDLEFSSVNGNGQQESENDVVVEDEGEFNFAVNSDGSSSGAGSQDTLSSLEPSSIVVAACSEDDDDEDVSSKTEQQLLVSFIKRATKYRVFMLRFRKPKSSASGGGGSDLINGAAAAEAEETAAASPKPKQQQQKRFFVNFKTDGVPVVSLFTRDSSSRSSSSGDSGGTTAKPATDVLSMVSVEDKSIAKEVLQKYFEKIMPFYVRVSKTKTDNLKLGELLSSPEGSTVAKEEMPAAVTGDGVKEKCEVVSEEKRLVGVGMKMVGKKLGKSRSVVSSAPMLAVPQRRDDSRVQVEDGIESAIAHCKRSYTVAGVEGKVK